MKRRLWAVTLCALMMAVLAFGAAPAGAPRSSGAAAKGGFLFITFKGEQTPMTEQIYFGLSPDGLRWAALKNGEPVLVSTLGEKGVRDPYILRAHDGKKFFIIGTDLNINLNKDWGRAVRAGSKSVVIWESEDLVKWSEPWLAKVAPDDAGCTWAPEAIYDEDAKDYMVYWASTTGRDDFKKHRIWAAHTKDFKEFSTPEMYIDGATTVIDTDIVWDGTKYYRFTKDEQFKAVSMQSSDKLHGVWTDVPGYTLAKMQGYEGPACFQISAATDTSPATWCLLLDYYSKGQGYKAWTTTDLAGGKFTADDRIQFPYRFRHGSVLTLSPEEYARVQAAYAK
jgi:hypothetical protein